MYFKTPVPIPDKKGKIILKKKGNSTYVLYQHGGRYVKDRHYVIPERAIIGKQCPDDPAKMYPNANFQKWFPGLPAGELRDEAPRSCCIKLGSWLAIRKTAAEYRLPEMLEKRFGKRAGLLLDLAAFSIVCEDNAAQHYPGYAFGHPLFTEGMKILSDTEISRTLESATPDQIAGFMGDWNERRDKRQQIYVSYDSTNKNCQAGETDLVEYGKPKDDRGFPVFNISLAFDRTNRVPLFYEEYPGSVTDVSQFKCMIEKAEEYGYSKIGFILDRGYFSRENIRLMDEGGHPFVIMARGCKSLVSSLVGTVRNTFETERPCLVREYRAYGTTVKAKLHEDDERERWFHVIYSPSRQAAEREDVERNIDKMRVFLESRIGTDEQFGKDHTDWFDLFYRDGKLVGVKEKSKAVKTELERCGYFCIITSEEMTAPEALTLYKGRDASEKLFQSAKTFLGGASSRVHSPEALSAKTFAEFVALVIRNRIYCLLKDTVSKMPGRPNWMTVPAALGELEKIELARIGGGRYVLDHAVTRRQKDILSSFGMNEEDVRKAAAEVSAALARSDGQRSEQKQQETENEEN